MQNVPLLLGAQCSRYSARVRSYLIKKRIQYVERVPALWTYNVTIKRRFGDPSVPVLILLVGLAGWMESARLVRAEYLTLKEREFVAAARAAGAGSVRVVVRHLLPGAVPTIVVSMTLAVGRGMLLESALSFFGVGVQPPAASWGSMLYQAQTTMSTEPWLALVPGAFIFVTSVAINVLGDELSAKRRAKA